MKSYPAVESAIKTAYNIRAIPEVVIEWSMNRYIGSVVDNTPSDELEGFDVDIFPIESVITTFRPTKGINKVRINSAMVGDDYQAAMEGGRFYIADEDDPYKYWTSPKPSNASGVLPLFNAANFPQPEDEVYNYDGLTCVRPTVVYSEDVSVNKIVITTENTWATAKDFEVQVATVENPTAAQWTKIADQSIGDGWKASGQIVLWFDGTKWVTTGRVDNTDKTPKTAQIRAVRIVVTTLEGGYKKTTDSALRPTQYRKRSGILATTDGKNAFFDLIEIDARLEVDISDHVISVDDTFDLGEVSNLYPLGTITANVGSLTLSNIYEDSNGESVIGLFSANNTQSPYHKFIDANAEVRLSYLYYDDSESLLGKVHQFKMYTELWQGQGEPEVDVSLRDFSKMFDSNEVKLPAAMWENLTVPELVWRILDSVGFTDYQIDHDADRVTEHTIPIFYTDGESTVWATLNDLAVAAQAAIYFDGNGILQVKTRDFAFSADNAPVWELSSNDSPDALAGIATLDMVTEFEPNHFKVTYQKTDWSAETRGQPTLQQVWTPEEENVVLRATALTKNLGVSGNKIWMAAKDVKVWPYEGLVNIEGEIIRYKGKEFVYFTGPTASVRNTMVLNDADDYKARNNQTPVLYRHKNHFTGALMVAERGVWNSEPKNHKVEMDGYRVHHIRNGNWKNNVGGLFHRKSHTRAELSSGVNFKDLKDIRLATRGKTEDNAFFNYGTRFRFLKQAGRTHQCGGIVIHNATQKEDGYFFQFMAKNKADKVKGAKVFQLIAREGGKEKVLSKSNHVIIENVDYEVDIDIRFGGGNHQINVFLNGKRIASVNVTGADRVAQNGTFGMFVRGQTRMEFEYLYALRREEESPLIEDFGFMDKVQRGYIGGQWDREWVFRWKDGIRKRKNKKNKKIRRRKNRQFFDEFGPIIHEIREYDVKFEPSPVLHSRLFLTNDYSACAVEYYADPYGAKFILANTSRANTVIHGRDSTTFSGTDDPVNQILSVLGRAIVTDEDEEVVAENSDQIRRRGKIESELSSPWIQSKGMANALADWMRDNFSYGNENLSVEIFGNPLIEVGDVVSVDYPEKHVSGDFFVTGASTSFSEGLSTTLQLRKRIS